jgi:hypothetical protein
MDHKPSSRKYPQIISSAERSKSTMGNSDLLGLFLGTRAPPMAPPPPLTSRKDTQSISPPPLSSPPVPSPRGRDRGAHTAPPGPQRGSGPSGWASPWARAWLPGRWPGLHATPRGERRGRRRRRSSLRVLLGGEYGRFSFRHRMSYCWASAKSGLRGRSVAYEQSA